MLRPSWFAVTRSGLPSPFRSPTQIQRGAPPVATVLERTTRGTEAAASDATPSESPAAEHASKAEPRLAPIGRFRPANARAIVSLRWATPVAHRCQARPAWERLRAAHVKRIFVAVDPPRTESEDLFVRPWKSTDTRKSPLV